MTAQSPEDPVRQLGLFPLRLEWTPGPDFVAPDADVIIFVHMRDGDGHRRFGADYRPDPPVSTWAPGEKVISERLVFVPLAAEPGTYEVRAGLYTATGRFVFASSGDPEPTDGVVLGELTVAPRDVSKEPVYIRGWHPLEVDVDRSWETWRWTSGDAVMRFKAIGDGGDLYFWLQTPDASAANPQRLELWSGDGLVEAHISMQPLPFGWNVAWPERAGNDEVTLKTDRLVGAGTRGGDPRPLGVKVLSAYLERR